MMKSRCEQPSLPSWPPARGTGAEVFTFPHDPYLQHQHHQQIRWVTSLPS